MTHDTAAHASEIRDALQTLAKLPAGAPVVSAYLDTHWDDEQQRERLRIEVKHRVQQIRDAYQGHPDEAGLEATLVELEHHVDGLVNQADDAATDFDGVAIFASVPRALWIVYRSRVPFETAVTVSDRPRLQPLARLLDDYQSAFVALVDPRRVRILEIALGGVVDASTLETDFPQHVQLGGHGHVHGAGSPRGGALAQIQYQRYLKALKTQNLKEGAEHLRRLMVHVPGAHLILGGDAEAMALFHDQLSADLAERVIDRTRLDDNEPAHRILARALEILEDHARVQETEGVDALVGLALSGNLGVLGPEDTLMALSEGRVYKLFLDDAEDLGNGTRCATCDAIFGKAHPGCPYCGGVLTTVDLAEEMVHRALAQDAEVDHVKRSPRLAHFGGMGALLRHGRQPISAGLGHAEHVSPTAL